LENNWLSHAQHEQYYRELRGAETYVDVLKVLAKWEVLSTQQTYATSLGIVDGMVQRGVQDVGAFYEALKNHKQTYDSLIELFSSVEGIKLAGQALANDYLTKLKTIKYALEHGQNPDEAFVMGQDLGAILFDVGSLVLGGTISAKAGSILAKAGLTYAPRITNAIIKSAAYVNRTFGALKSQSLRILKHGVEIGVARFDEATQRFIHTFKEGFGLSDELQYATSDGLSFSQRELDDLNVNYHKNNGLQGAGKVFREGDNLVGIAIKQIKNGTNEKYAIIGRSMGNAEITGVRNVYSELKNIQKLDLEIFDASSLNGIWKTKFDDALTEFAEKTNNWTTKLSNQELLQLKMYKLNKEWAQHLVDDGYTILDMGDFNNLGFSAFYSMEKMIIFK
jgi:hypothetical protein